MISFSMKDLTVSEVLAGLTEALARIALLPAALAGGFGAALEAINGLLGVFGIPGIDEIIGTIKDTIDQISEIIENLEDLKDKVKENIRNALSSLARTISQEILVGIVDFLIEKFQGLFDLPLPSIPEIPDFILQIPETFSELFNIQPPIINFSLAPPNILSEFFAFFQGILDFFTSQVPTLDFISSLMAALAQGAAGLVEFLIEIVTGIFEEVFDLASGAVVKIATAIVVINRIVRYLAIALVGYLLGNGLIFEGIANELRGV
jgi:phage-related protein